MARNNEPAFRRKTPLLICSIRTEIPYPCIGSSANVFRMSMSSVPWTRSLGLSGINLVPLGYQEEHTLFLLVVKRKRPEDSWRQANSQGVWRRFGAKTESNMVQKTAERPGRAPCVPNAVRESHVSTRRRCCASQECSSSDPPLREPDRRACRDESIRDRQDEKLARGRMSPPPALEAE